MDETSKQSPPAVPRIVTVLPPYLPYLERSEGDLSYRIWSDQTKPREGKIPFRIVK